MKCVIAYKWARNPQDGRVGADGSVDWSASKLSPSDEDAAAAEIARRLDGESVAVTIGDGDAVWAAARGASRTVHITDAVPDADASRTAQVLAAGTRHIGDVDLVLLGDSPWDSNVPAALGASLGWTTVVGVLAAEIDGDTVRVTRQTPTGAESLEVTLPAVLAVVARRAEVTTPGMKEVLLARKKPMEKTTLGELGISPGSGVRLLETTLPETAPARVFDGSDPVAAATQLVAALRREGVL